jgi:hypothetical protein
MNRTKAAALAIAMSAGWILVIPAEAAPPTVTPSPGYDARLQEQRAASSRINSTASFRDDAKHRTRNPETTKARVRVRAARAPE